MPRKKLLYFGFIIIITLLGLVYYRYSSRDPKLADAVGSNFAVNRGSNGDSKKETTSPASSIGPLKQDLSDDDINLIQIQDYVRSYFFRPSTILPEITKDEREKVRNLLAEVHAKVSKLHQKYRTQLASGSDGGVVVEIRPFTEYTSGQFYSDLETVLGTQKTNDFLQKQSDPVRKLFLGFGQQPVKLEYKPQPEQRLRLKITMGAFMTIRDAKDIPPEYQHILRLE
jgi:hypothetical protein